MMESATTRIKGKYIILFCALLLPFVGVAVDCRNETRAKEVTFGQLIDSPAQYNGRVIVIDGFFFSGFEVQVLSERLQYSVYAEGHAVPAGKMLWVDGGIPQETYDQLYQQSQMGPAERYGRLSIKGKFDYGGKYGHLGEYSYQIEPIAVSLIPWSPPANNLPVARVMIFSTYAVRNGR
jgi:hypothetical protein